MADVQSDKFLEAGFIGLVVKHPITGEDVESLVPTSGYSQNQPGVRKFAADMSEGELSEAHEGKSLSDIALIVFSELAEAKTAQYVLDALTKSDGAIAEAAKEAKVAGWRAKLDGDDFTEYMALGIDLWEAREATLATLADLDAQIAEAKAEVADKLDLSPTFDVAHVSTGWYVSSETKTKGSKQVVIRDYTADHYESKAGRKINGVEVASTADVTSRDEEGNPDGWKVTYTAKGKSYSATADSLNAANAEARTACMTVIAKGASTACNAPKWFRVPKATVAAK